MNWVGAQAGGTAPFYVGLRTANAASTFAVRVTSFLASRIRQHRQRGLTTTSARLPIRSADDRQKCSASTAMSSRRSVKRRQDDTNDIEAIEQVETEATRCHLGAQVAIGGGDETNVDATTGVPPTRRISLPESPAAAWLEREPRVLRLHRGTTSLECAFEHSRRSATAPVNAPRAWLNNSDSTRSSGSAAQFRVLRRDDRVVDRVCAAVAQPALSRNHFPFNPAPQWCWRGLLDRRTDIDDGGADAKGSDPPPARRLDARRDASPASAGADAVAAVVINSVTSASCHFPSAATRQPAIRPRAPRSARARRLLHAHHHDAAMPARWCRTRGGRTLSRREPSLFTTTGASASPETTKAADSAPSLARSLAHVPPASPHRRRRPGSTAAIRRCGRRREEGGKRGCRKQSQGRRAAEPRTFVGDGADVCVGQ